MSQSRPQAELPPRGRNGKNVANGTHGRRVTQRSGVAGGLLGVVLNLAAALPLRAAEAPAVDAATLQRKMLLGYQGWFACPGDGSPLNRWTHWARGAPRGDNLTVDMWPDVSELDADELFPTEMTLADGSPAKLYSAFNAKTVARHFRWMQEAGIDGVLVQRFAGETRDPRHLEFRDQVLRNARVAAERYGRVFAVEYDASARDADQLQRDWQHLVDEVRATESPRYLRHKGRPVLCVWGFGFSERPGTAEQAKAFVDWLKTGPEK